MHRRARAQHEVLCVGTAHCAAWKFSERNLMTRTGPAGKWASCLLGLGQREEVEVETTKPPSHHTEGRQSNQQPKQQKQQETQSAPPPRHPPGARQSTPEHSFLSLSLPPECTQGHLVCNAAPSPGTPSLPSYLHHYVVVVVVVVLSSHLGFIFATVHRPISLLARRVRLPLLALAKGNPGVGRVGTRSQGPQPRTRGRVVRLVVDRGGHARHFLGGGRPLLVDVDVRQVRGAVLLGQKGGNMALKGIVRLVRRGGALLDGVLQRVLEEGVV